MQTTENPTSNVEQQTKCECQHWANVEPTPYKGKSIHGTPLIPNHHPHCPRYNDSLMTVWRVTDGCTSYFVSDEIEARREVESGEGELTCTQEKMHREVFENLPEFDGF